MVDSIRLGEVLLAVGVVGEISCGSTGCLSCRGKQSTSSSSSLSSGRSLLFSILVQSIVAVDLSVGDSNTLLQLVGPAVGRGAMAVSVEYHGGLGGIGIKNTMVTLLVTLITGGHVGFVLECT